MAVFATNLGKTLIDGAKNSPREVREAKPLREKEIIGPSSYYCIFLDATGAEHCRHLFFLRNRTKAIFSLRNIYFLFLHSSSYTVL